MATSAGRTAGHRAASTAAAQPPSTGMGVRNGGRAFGLGPRGVAVAVAVTGAVIAVAIVAILGGGSAHSTRATASEAKYGGLPSWLPKAKPEETGRVLHGSASHPAYSVEGEAVSVSLAGASVTATAVGPDVPEEGRFPVPAVTPATFIVTFSKATAAVPVRASSLTLVDEHGFAYHPKVTAVGGGAPPQEITPSHPTSVELHAIIPTGDGAVAWTPEGSHALAAWNYTVEID